MSDKVYITPGGARQLRDEVNHLWKVKRPEITRIVSAAAALGDRSENADYIYGKKQLREIDKRIRYLTRRLDNLEIVDRKPDDFRRIFFGAWVTLEEQDGTEVTYRIVGADEFDLKQGWISIASPLARSLLGKTVGDDVMVKRPKGAAEIYVAAVSYDSPGPEPHRQMTDDRPEKQPRPMKNPTRSGGLPDFQRDNIARMEGYLPGEQLNDSSIIKLNTNENPFPPSTPVQEALRKLEPTDLRRYPDPLSTGFRSAIAQTHGLNLDATIATRGGDELLRLVITTFVEPGSTIGMTDPTYSLYETLAEIHACPTFKVDISRHWKPAPDFAAMMNHINARLILLVNPHAPSGSLLPISQIDAICAEARGIVLLDEAYIDFVDPALAYDAIPLLARHGNLIILRTLSKGYSLAGMRLGYGLASPGLIAPMLTKTRDSYNLDTISQRVGEAALAGRDESRRSWATVRAERARLRTELAGRGIETLPSESNFLLARIPNSVAASDGPDAHRTYLGLKDRKILVRYFSTPALADRLRISVGTPEENSALLAALDDIRAGK